MAQNTQYSDFSIPDLAYSKPKKNSRGGISVWLNTSATDSSKPRVQLEKCRSPFGIREPMEAGGRKSLDLAVSSEKLLQWCSELDDKNVNTVADNSEAFFKNKMSKEVVTEFYKKLVTPGKGDYEPLLKIKISEYEGSQTKVFLMKKDPVTKKDTWERGTLEDVKEQCEVLPIVELQMLWFINKNFGMSLVATDLLVWPSVPIGMGFVFESESESEETPLPAAVPASELRALEPEPAESGETAPPAEHVPLGEAAPDETSEATSSSDNCSSDDE